jgi:hypothetical protein
MGTREMRREKLMTISHYFNPLIISYFTLHTSPFILHPSYFTLHTSYFTLHTSPFILSSLQHSGLSTQD